MKMYADLKISENEYKRISIWDIINSYNDATEQEYKGEFRNYYKENYKNLLFSTHKDINQKKEMYLCIKEPYACSYFKYKYENYTNESAQHELFKKIISEFTTLNLCCNNELITLYITKSEAEYEYTANGKHYRTDIYFEFNKSEPEEYLYKWNGKLCFEIKYSNAVDETKKDDCVKEKLAMVEHQISEVFSNNIKEISDKKSYYETLKNLKIKLSNKIFIKILSNPSPPAYNELLLYKQKYIDLREENDKLSNELISVKTKYDIILNNKLLKLLIKAFGIK